MVTSTGVVKDFTEGRVYLDSLCERLELAEARVTSSGLHRVDGVASIPEVALVMEEIKTYLRERYESFEEGFWWGMKHLPGSESVSMHSHNSWNTVLYYPRSHESGLLLPYQGTEDPIALPIESDMLVVLPVGKMHGVAKNNSDTVRLSIVGLFKCLK